MNKVKIVDYKERTSDDGRIFYALELNGGIDVAVSKNGNSYITTKRASIPTTFGEEMCKSLIGQEIKGSIVREECEPYSFTNSETGEVVKLNHRNVFYPMSEDEALEQEANKLAREVFS